MLSYKLLKQLNAAGFWKGRLVGALPFDQRPTPSLEELIEACGHYFMSLDKEEDLWEAMGYNYCCDEHGEGRSFGKGSTPSEAVAKEAYKKGYIQAGLDSRHQCNEISGDKLKEAFENGKKEAREEVINTILHSKLAGILRYRFARGAGHTYAEVKGVENVKNAVLIVANEQQKRSTGLPDKQVISINSTSKGTILSGRRIPIVIDHYALQVMFDEIIQQLTTK